MAPGRSPGTAPGSNYLSAKGKAPIRPLCNHPDFPSRSDRAQGQSNPLDGGQSNPIVPRSYPARTGICSSGRRRKGQPVFRRENKRRRTVSSLERERWWNEHAQRDRIALATGTAADRGQAGAESVLVHSLVNWSLCEHRVANPRSPAKRQHKGLAKGPLRAPGSATIACQQGARRMRTSTAMATGTSMPTAPIVRRPLRFTIVGSRSQRHDAAPDRDLGNR